MRILALVHKNSGVSYHRLIAPLMHMEGIDIFLTNDPKEEHFDKGCDILMWNRTIGSHLDELIARMKEKHGFKVCLDLDDFWELDPHHILYEYYKENGFVEEQIRHIKMADVIICTHGRLALEAGLINPNVHVCPNAIPHQGQFDIKNEYSPDTRLFWQGSGTHEKDIEILEHPISELKSIGHKIKMVMGGIEQVEDEEGKRFMTDEWERMAKVYTAQFTLGYKLIPGEPVTNYYSMYAHADICLVPLVRSKFNGFKSNLKVLEAANMGLPVIASQVDPYLNAPINYCKSSRDWVGHIKRLVQWPKQQYEEGQRLKEWANVNFNFEKINEHRRQILEYECKKQAV